MLELKNINITNNKKECIRNGAVQFLPGQITCIYGESGTGKTSLLNLIGLLSKYDCDYYYNGKLIRFEDNIMSSFRNQYISYITQNSNLIENISVIKNIELCLEISRAHYTAEELLSLVKLLDKKNDLPKKLSGGERQRIALACSLARDTQIILGDEITAALDEENKKLIIEILKECAAKGKIIVLVSHDPYIIKESDKVYSINHLNIIEEKQSDMITQQNNKSLTPVKYNVLKVFQLLFHSNKKINIERIIMSFFVICTTLFCAFFYSENMKIINRETFSVNDISSNRLLVLNDESGDFSSFQYGYALKNILYPQPFSKTNVDEICKTNNIKSIYDYYTLSNNMVNSNGRMINMSLKLNGYQYDNVGNEFIVVPYYPEELNRQEGVYINTNIAKNYNIAINDVLTINLNIPFAMLKSVYEQEYNKGYPFYPVICVASQIPYEAKVIGIIESNSTFSNEIYMPYDIMKTMIDIEVNKYSNGDIVIKEETYEGVSELIELYPYAKTIFIEGNENVLKAQKSIADISDKIYVYNEYQSVLELQEQNDKLIFETGMITTTVILGLMVGMIFIQVIYKKRRQSSYLMLRLYGFANKEIFYISIFELLWQLLICATITMILSLFIYIPKFNTTSADISPSFKFMFVLLTISILIVSYTINQIDLKNKNISKWIRGR